MGAGGEGSGGSGGKMDGTLPQMEFFTSVAGCWKMYNYRLALPFGTCTSAITFPENK